MDREIDSIASDEVGESWVRAGWLWSLIFGSTLVTSFVITLLQNNLSTGTRLLVISLTLFLAICFLLHFYFAVLSSRQGEKRFSWYSYLYVGLVIPAWFYLTQIDPVYYFVLFGFFPQIFYFLPLRWAVLISLVVSALVAIPQSYGSETPFFRLDNVWLWFFLFTGVAGGGLAFFIEGIIRQSTQRRDLIRQLQETQAALAESKRREGILAERERLARDIHDTVAQGVISIITHLEASDENWTTDREKSHHHLLQAQKMARQGVNQARRVVQNLRPDVLENQSLFEGIEQVASDWSQQSGIEVQAVTTGPPLALSTAQETVLVRVVQEGLANVQKHAEACNVQITLSYMDNLVMLDLQDDGIGFSSESKNPHAQNGGFGLRAMEQRVTQAGGSLELESEPGEGTTLVVQLPVRPAPVISDQ